LQCGPIRFSADAKSQIEKQTFKRYLIPRFTSFRSLCEDKKSFTPIRQEIAEDEVRNQLIVEDVKKALDSGRTPILLADLTSHVEALTRLQNVPADEPLVIVATGKYVGEGFDYPRLDTLFLVSPISWKGRLQQYAGRLHRECEGKKDVRIYDYIDICKTFGCDFISTIIQRQQECACFTSVRDIGKWY